MSVEDVNRNLEIVEEMAHHTRLLCLTEAEAGSVLYWNGDRRRFRPPVMDRSGWDRCGRYFCGGIFCAYVSYA